MGVKLSEWKLRVTENVERVMSKVTAAAEKTAARFNALQDRINKAGNAIRSVADEVPGLNRAIELASNPYVAIAASAMALGSILFTSAQHAAAFNNEFLDLKLVNLDKTQGQLDQLKNSILNLSLVEGINPKAVNQAFADVQGGTGKYGAEVEEIVRKVGRFSLATKTELPDSIGGAVKAMLAFGFGVEKMDQYLASSAKTVQVGIVSFKELAKVQTEYAGAAAAANQNFDTANKVFAAFTQTAKDANIAATMTKGAFQGLTMQSTIDGLKKIGINMFDAKGKMLAVDQIIEQLVPKFKNLSDAQFLKLRNEIGGPEGLQNLLNQVKSSGDSVLQMFKEFDTINFDVDQALKNAKGDFTTLSQIVSAQYSTVMIKLGEQVLPTFARALSVVSAALVWVGKNSELISDVLSSLAIGIGVAGLAWGGYKLAMIAAQLTTWGMIGACRALSAAIMSIPIVGWVAAGISALVLMYQTWDEFRAVVDGVLNVFMEMLPLVQAIGKMMLNIGNPVAFAQAAGGVVDAFNKMDIGKAYNEGHDRSMAASKASREAEQEDPFAGIGAGQEEQQTSKSPAIQDGLKEVNEGGRSVRNVTLNIESLIKNLEIKAATVREGAEDIRRIVLEEIVRATNGAEQAVS